MARKAQATHWQRRQCELAAASTHHPLQIAVVTSFLSSGSHAPPLYRPAGSHLPPPLAPFAQKTQPSHSQLPQCACAYSAVHQPAQVAVRLLSLEQAKPWLASQKEHLPQAHWSLQVPSRQCALHGAICQVWQNVALNSGRTAPALPNATA